MNNNYYSNGQPQLQSQPGSPLFTNGVETPNQSGTPNMNFNYNNNNPSMSDTLTLNKGKIITVFATFNGSVSWPDKAFTGILENYEMDHLTLSDPKTGKWYVIPTIYVDYVESDEKIIE